MEKSDKRRSHYLQPCRCGTGCYCRRHQRYAIEMRERKRIEVSDPHLSDDEPCGGGHRVIRKAVRD